MNTTEFRDLGKLARERSRNGVMSVGQLLDSNQERAALLASCAVDFIHGATVMLKDDTTNEDEALGEVLSMILATIGIGAVTNALKTRRGK